VDVVIRPEDIDIVKPEMGKMLGTVQSILFKGVHFEIVVKTSEREWIVHTTDKSEVGEEVGLHFFPEDIHIMYKMGSY
jgi:spermidine/putrescine transport system ATP-binding protein